MATGFEIPLTPSPQQFWITLANAQYSLTVRWCWPASCWTLDVADTAGAALATGLPLVGGDDLLTQLAYLGIGGSMIVATDGNFDADPTFDNLGVASHLYFVTP